MAHNNKLGNPGHDYEKNVNIQSPLDEDGRVEIGGEILAFLQADSRQMRNEMKQLKDLFLYLVQITELAYETELTDVDRSKIEEIENGT